MEVGEIEGRVRVGRVDRGSRPIPGGRRSDSLRQALTQVDSPVGGTTAAEIERATLGLVRLESDLANESLDPVCVSLLHCVSSSMGGVSVEDLAAASTGLSASRLARAGAVQMKVTEQLVAKASASRRIEFDDVVKAFRVLGDAPRSVGDRMSLHSGDLDLTTSSAMRHLVSFANRRDVPVLMQAGAVSIAGADIGLGAPGVALGHVMSQVVLRVRGATRTGYVAMPGATDLPERISLVDLDSEDDARWRFIATATSHRVESLSLMFAALRRLVASWVAALRPRRSSALSRLLPVVAFRPVIDAETAGALIDCSPPATYDALGRLERSGVLVELSGFRRNRVWAAPDVFEVVDRASSVSSAAV